MITEDYCSFEIAKLLKEKGFNEKCRAFYNDKTLKITYIDSPINNEKPFNLCLLAPTIQMAMKWLREVHNIEVNISMSTLNSDGSREYMFDVFFTNKRYLEPSKTKAGFKCYEEACEAAIKYCLTNLIK